MKKYIFSTAAIVVGLSVYAASAAADDPVLMTVNNHDIRLSEFEYLYNKNNSQQLTKQPIDEYIGMFVDYKLKVADAEAAGIDTTAAFLTEYSQFRNDLAAPLLKDHAVEDSLLRQAYSHYTEDVNVSHIMFYNDDTSEENDARLRSLAESVRDSVLAGDMTFDEAAARYSIDRGTKDRGGKMGWLIAGRYPWNFEVAAFDTPIGSISHAVNSGYGYHIIKVNERRPSRGEVKARHILRLTRGLNEEDAARQESVIDSIYNAIMAGDDFAVVAKSESQDPGSARNGGDLGWFGSGVMIAEFDSVAFATPTGEISKPFKTAFGWHIVQTTDRRPTATYDEMLPKLKEAIAGDSRGNLAARSSLRRFVKKYNSHLIDSNLDRIEGMIAANPAGLDSAMRATLAVTDIDVAEVNGKSIKLSEVMAEMPVSVALSAKNGRQLISSTADDILEKRTLECAAEDLALTDTDYRNLLNEYRDGILLFEISNRNVWDKANKDKEGLEKFFRKNIRNYAWDKPRFKGYIIFSTNDSLLNAAYNYADSLPTIDPAVFARDMRAKFGRDLRVERVIAAQGDNPITDYLAFGAEKPVNEKTHWTHYRAFRGEMLDSPREVADVRGKVTADYQQYLEKEWLKRLHKKYKVKINKKVLDSISK